MLPRWPAVAPPGLMRAARLVGLVNPRNGDLIEFGCEVSLSDCVAPVRGQERLRTYFERHLGGF